MDLLTRKTMVLLVTIIFTIISVTAKGEVYKIDWTNRGELHYKSWAASKNFHIGDVIVFEYNKEFHNVVRVTHKNFNACNATSPYATWATGNDTFPIKKHGHFYFICSVPGHCQAGQRVDIRVPKPDTPSPKPEPSPSPSPSPNAPAPSPSSSSPLYSSWMIWPLVLLTTSILYQ